MKYFMGVCIAVFCIAAIASSAAFADECHMGKCNMMSGHGKMSHEMEASDIFFHKSGFILSEAAELGLSSDQVEKVKALKYSVEKNMVKEDADIKTLAIDIKEAVGKDEIDVNAVNKLIDQKYSLKAQKTKESIAAYVNLRKILTQDQLKKLKDMCQNKMKGGHKGWRERKGSAEEKKEMSEESAE